MAVDLGAWRIAAVALASHACGGKAGRSKDDPVYDAWTEGRDHGAARRSYSSCGDLGHGLLEALGVRAPWLNRKSLGQYRVGMNLSLFNYSAPARYAWFRNPRATLAHNWLPEPGDILIIANSPTGADGHCLVVLDSSLPGEVTTANYGAGGMSAASYPGAKIAHPALRFDGRSWLVGSRVVRTHVSLADVLPGSARPRLDGVELLGEVLDAIGAVP